MMCRSCRIVPLLIVIVIVIASASGFAESEPPGPVDLQLSVVPVFESVPDRWQPPARNPALHDWLRLKSGEWMRGSLDRVLDGTVYFDSKELDDLEIDWVDIDELRSSHVHTYRLQEPGSDDDVILTGTAGMVSGVLRIDNGTKVYEFDRAALVGMIAGGLKESDFWSLELSLGFTVRSGNSDQSDLSSHSKIQRETALTRGFVEYRGSISSVSGSTTADNHRVTTQFDYYLTRQLFITVPTIELFRDPFQNTALRTTAGVGVGYDLVKRGKVNWDIGGGVSFQGTQFDTAPAGDPKESKDAALALSTSVEFEPTPRIDWDTSYQVQLVATDFDRTNHHMTSVVSIEVWGPLDLDVTAVWDWIAKPPRASDGARPASNDLRVTVGLGVDF